MRRKPKKQRRSCGEHIADRIAANRDRKVEGVFSALEEELLRDRLSVLTPEREKEKQNA